MTRRAPGGERKGRGEEPESSGDYGSSGRGRCRTVQQALSSGPAHGDRGEESEASTEDLRVGHPGTGPAEGGVRGGREGTATAPDPVSSLLASRTKPGRWTCGMPRPCGPSP